MSDFDKLRDELRRQGFPLTQTNRGHWRAAPPGKPPNGVSSVTFSDSADPRAIKNTISDLRKIGFEWPPPQKRNGDGVVEHYELILCPHCNKQTFNARSAFCENLGGCPTHAPVDTDALYAEVKASKELIATAQKEFVERERAYDAAKLALNEARATLDQMRAMHTKLKERLIRNLEED